MEYHEPNKSIAKTPPQGPNKSVLPPPDRDPKAHKVSKVSTRSRSKSHQARSNGLDKVVKPPHRLQESLLLGKLLLGIRNISAHTKPVGRPRVQRNLIRLIRALQQHLDLGAASGREHGVGLGESEADGLGDGRDLGVEQQARVGGEADVDVAAGAEEAEGVLAAEAVAGDGDLGNAGAAAGPGDGLGDDGVDVGRAVAERVLGQVEAGDVEVGGEGLALEHVGGDGEVAGLGEGVGEAGVGVRRGGEGGEGGGGLAACFGAARCQRRRSGRRRPCSGGPGRAGSGDWGR